MPKSYSVADARSHLPAIIDQVQAGRPIELTRRGRPVAVVVSCREFDRLRGERHGFGDAYRDFLKRYSLDEIGLEKGFARKIRDSGPGRKVPL